MQLNKIYDKSYVVSIYRLIQHLAEKEKNKYYDPAFDKYTILDKKKIFLECWREYFKILMPIFIKKDTSKIEKKETINKIHLIFGNEISQMTRILYSNALFFRVGIKTLYSNIEKYKKYV